VGAGNGFGAGFGFGGDVGGRRGRSFLDGGGAVRLGELPQADGEDEGGGEACGGDQGGAVGLGFGGGGRGWGCRGRGWRCGGRGSYGGGWDNGGSGVEGLAAGLRGPAGVAAALPFESGDEGRAGLPALGGIFTERLLENGVDGGGEGGVETDGGDGGFADEFEEQGREGVGDERFFAGEDLVGDERRARTGRRGRRRLCPESARGTCSWGCRRRARFG
jgi:hypothetical protein